MYMHSLLNINFLLFNCKRSEKFQFEISNMITPWIGQYEVQLPIIILLIVSLIKFEMGKSEKQWRRCPILKSWMYSCNWTWHDRITNRHVGNQSETSILLLLQLPPKNQPIWLHAILDLITPITMWDLLHNPVVVWRCTILTWHG